MLNKMVLNGYEQKLCCNPLNISNIGISLLICCGNQWTGFYMRETLVFNGLRSVSKGFWGKKSRRSRKGNCSYLLSVHGS